MTDLDTAGNAWKVPPSRYLAGRPPEYRCPTAPRSQYVVMRDGCRIAVDLWLPEALDGGAAPERVPTIAILTPYYRRFALQPGAGGVEASPNAARYRDALVPRGYAVLVVDVRGTGASFGTRDSFRSPAEREDFRELADWVVAQPWSDGVIGSTGVSYLGAASAFLASTGHPAVKAIAPLFAVWNTYVDHYYPGGVLLNKLAESYDEIMIGLDHDRRDLLAKQPYFGNPAFAGPQPVDADADGTLLRAAVAEHLGNFHMPDFITEFRFTDDRLPYDPSFGAPSFSPYHYAEGIRPDVAIYSVSGWMDGAGFTNGSIARHLSLPNRHQHLLIGPWDHGARTNVSPWRSSPDAKFDVMAEVLRFFDHYLMGRDTGLQDEQPIHYFSLHEESWKTAAAWPPVSETRSLYLEPGLALAETAGPAGEAAYQVDFTVGTGTNTRHERLAALATTDYYPDWQGRDAAMLCFTSAPLAEAAEITGHPVADLWVASSQSDAVLHVYLSEIEADGTARYVTEGVLRALHRQEAEPERFQRWSWPFRNFSRANARPMTPGVPERLRFGLLPTSWTFRKGSRIRLSIAGADSDHYVQLPYGRPPLLSIRCGGDMASALTLPWRTAS